MKVVLLILVLVIAFSLAAMFVVDTIRLGLIKIVLDVWGIL